MMVISFLRDWFYSLGRHNNLVLGIFFQDTMSPTPALYHAKLTTAEFNHFNVTDKIFKCQDQSYV